jgi:hypothetical protein
MNKNARIAISVKLWITNWARAPPLNPLIQDDETKITVLVRGVETIAASKRQGRLGSISVDPAGPKARRLDLQ